MAARFSPQDVLESEVKRRLGPHVQRRGDGFTEAESMGLLQLVRTRWREGWDVIAQLHNAQFAKHNRSADSLKKKFSRLYRSNIPARGAKNHQAIIFAHSVHKEMVEGVPPAPGTALSSIDGDTPVDASETSFQPSHGDERVQDGATESEHSWVDTAAEVPAAAGTTAVMTTALPDPASVATPPPAAAAVAVPRPRARAPRSTTDWQNPAAVFPPEATPLPTDDLVTSVLKVILRSQYQRDLDREEERQRREEERQRRREDVEQRRQEEDRRRDEEREERRRRNEERAEERAENRRRHEQFMQMMMLLVGKNGAPQQRDTEC
ncbi:hypothetical protein PHYPSEUDO_004438 [Phytophthora pseudosyringae]|uniref:Uncharacterized protein n=1 Tax=Phytophthora pseudosyringae TaxID=221518 RepID=A0A8T1WK85_9STRA|nr:hypothetical protein PHYPSEUDO_004438 [Phytophthora pseudosyringae]